MESQCNLQCDCKCGLLAELEGIKLDMVIMLRNIESNTCIANIVQEEEDTSILERGRDAEISKQNNIIASLQTSSKLGKQ